MKTCEGRVAVTAAGRRLDPAGRWSSATARSTLTWSLVQRSVTCLTGCFKGTGGFQHGLAVICVMSEGGALRVNTAPGTSLCWGGGFQAPEAKSCALYRFFFAAGLILPSPLFSAPVRFSHI